jgi:hypothetical protein
MLDESPLELHSKQTARVICGLVLMKEATETKG